MREEIIIRRAVEDDVEDITRIYNYAILNTTATFDMEPKSVEDRVQWFRRHSDAYPVFVVEWAGKVVGWASLSPYGERRAFRYTVENAVYIDCDYQGRGAGSALMQALMSAAQEAGYHAVIALIVGANESSARLHEKFGFVFVGRMREVGRKFDEWLDLLVYERILGLDRKNWT